MIKRNNLGDFGNQLQRMRKERKLTQEQLLQLLREQRCEKYSKGDISKWENDYYRPPSEVVEYLEDILRAPPGFLLDAAQFYEEAEYRRQENVINQLKEYIKEQFKFLAAANNLEYKDIDSGEWVSPSLREQTEAWMHQIRPGGLSSHG